MTRTRSPGYHPLLVSTGVRASATRSPGKVALSTVEREVTYAALVSRLNRIVAAATGVLGQSAGARIGVMLPNGIEILELVLGLSDAGLVPVLINPHATAPEIDHICDDAALRLLFVHHGLEAQARTAALRGIERIVVVGPEYETLLDGAPDAEPAVVAEEEDIFAILYTSGTSGQPKGVMLSHRSRTSYMLLAMAANQGRSRPDLRALAVAPLWNGAGFVNGLAAIWFGGSCHIMERFAPEPLLRTIAERGITTLFLVPTHFHGIFDLPSEVLRRHDVGSLHTIVAGGAALPQATKERIVAHFGEGKLFEGYGSTEAGGITGLRPEDQLRTHRSVGRMLTGVEMRIVDDAGQALPPGTVGEVICRSPMLFHGYLNLDQETREVLRDGWYYSGDLGLLDTEGYLYIVDRKKNMIVSGAQNVYPREIEEVLHRHPSVADAAVVGQPDPYWGEVVTAYVVQAAGCTVDATALKEHCAKYLARYKLPKAFQFVDSLPRNANGKVLHRLLRMEAPSN